MCLYSTWYQTRSRCQIDLKEFICLQKKQSIDWCVDVWTQVGVCWNCQYIMKCGVTFGEMSLYLANVTQSWKIVEIIVSCEKVLYDHCLYISISCNEYKRLSWSYLFQFHLLYIVHIIINCLMLGFSWKNCVIFASGKGHLFFAYNYSDIILPSLCGVLWILFYFIFFSIYDKCDKVMPILY